LEDSNPLHELSGRTPLEILSEYVKYDPNNPVPKEVTPDLDDYDIDMDFLSSSSEFAPSSVVIAAKAPDSRTQSRLCVQRDGTMKAVRTSEPLLGKRIVDIKAPVYEVTPEKGIIVPPAAPAK